MESCYSGSIFELFRVILFDLKYYNFSGVLGSLLLKDQELPQHCTVYPHQTWDEMHKAIIEPLMENTVNATLEDETRIFAGLCFRKVEYPDSSQLLFGHPLIQNEYCQ